ncbi:unnamed protein product [Arctia plantaginis]|uniref:Uncharacterized protein n=1 Tax=Arctia plantaginis TaxID=874455 RepID=A0A8S1BVL6_ARCPL|nr:unnamed protein product [Arctia plantaginis]CAB3261241.1 unnamed protein product [Arctia plantaginis]
MFWLSHIISVPNQLTPLHYQNYHVSAIFIKNAWPPASWRWSTASKALKASATPPTSNDRAPHPLRHQLLPVKMGRRDGGDGSLYTGLRSLAHLSNGFD